MSSFFKPAADSCAPECNLGNGLAMRCAVFSKPAGKLVLRSNRVGVWGKSRKACGMKIKVLIVDDSALIRSVMSEIVRSQPDMEVVGVAPDPLVARELIKQTNPDVLTLDVEMPKMDGLDFLEKLMRLRPMPVLMVSSLDRARLRDHVAGAGIGGGRFRDQTQDIDSKRDARYTELIAEKIRAAAKARVKPRQIAPPFRPERRIAADSQPADQQRKIDHRRRVDRRHRGDQGFSGADAVRLPRHFDHPAYAGGVYPIVCQAARRHLQNSVKEAENGERILPGHAFIAPGHSHLLLARSGANYVTHLDQGPPVTAIGRRSMSCSFGSGLRRQERGGCYSYGNGQGWRARHAGNEKGRRL